MTHSPQFATLHHVKLHYLDYAGGDPPLILMHGLTANAASFALIAPRLSQRLRVIVPDLRGRGLSDKPATGYTIADHAGDMIGLMDVLGLKTAVMGGHSYGGMVSLYLAAHFPERVSSVILLDAGLLHPQVADLIRPSTERIGKRWPSWEAYREQIMAAPYLQGAWEPAVEAYFRADVIASDDGGVTTRSAPEVIAQAASGVAATPWLNILTQVSQPTLLLNAPNSYGLPGAPAVQPAEQARATAGLLRNCRVVEVPGNHVTMLFSAGAAPIADAILLFVSGHTQG
jgi:pimeloyl-ACP methyl ester carboxylesterase